MSNETETTQTAERRRHNDGRSAAYAKRHEDSLKIRRIGNGFLVTEIDREPFAYPELGAEVRPPDEGCDPLTVAEHIAAFFAAREGEYDDAAGGA